MRTPFFMMANFSRPSMPLVASMSGTCSVMKSDCESSWSRLVARFTPRDNPQAASTEM